MSVKKKTRTSSAGSTNITLQFELDRDIDAAAQDVQTAISQSVRRLPDNMPTPPTLRKVNPADSPILFIALSANQLPLTDLDDYAETRVAQQISTIPGVAQVLVFGSKKYAVRLQMNPYALAARNLSLAQVEAAIQGGNTNLPTGTLSGSVRSYAVQAEGCAPIVRAFEKGEEFAERWEGAATVAIGIRVPRAVGDFLILRAVRDSGGAAIAVPEDAILQAVEDAAHDDGVLLCPEGGAVLAAWRQALTRGLVTPDERVLLFNCANGNKYPLPDRSKRLKLAEAEPNAL